MTTRAQALSQMKTSGVRVHWSQSPKMCFFPPSLQRIQHYVQRFHWQFK